MPAFGIRSLTNLGQAHKDLQVIFKEVIKQFDCTVICGHRSKEAQNKAYSDGFSKVQYPNSKHNSIPSMAVDVVPYPIDWKDTNRMYLFNGFVLATAIRLKEEGKITHDLRLGSDWDSDTQVNDHRFIDLPHFELMP